MRYERYGAATTRSMALQERSRRSRESQQYFSEWVSYSIGLESIVDFLSTGHVTIHWSRVMLGAFFAINLSQVLGTLCTLKIDPRPPPAPALCAPHDRPLR